MQIVRQLTRTGEVVHVHERMGRCYGLVVSSPCAHHDRHYFVSEKVAVRHILITAGRYHSESFIRVWQPEGWIKTIIGLLHTYKIKK